jgi:hypothetical protein
MSKMNTGASQMTGVTVKVRCALCGATRTIEGKQPTDFVPICDTCFMPMIAVEARLKNERQ